MSGFQSHALILRSVQYGGESLGNEWQFDLDVNGEKLSFQIPLKKGETKDLNLPLCKKTLRPSEKKSVPVELTAVLTELDAVTPDTGNGYLVVDLKEEGIKSFAVTVIGLGRRDKGKKASITLRLETRAVPSNHVSTFSAPRGFTPVSASIGKGLGMLGTLLESLSGEAGDRIDIKLVKIENVGDGIGGDLLFNIRFHGHTQSGAEFSQKVKRGANAVDIPVFSAQMAGQFQTESEIGVTVQIIEDDPVYPDVGIGTGKIFVTGDGGGGQVEVTVPATGGDEPRIGRFILYFEATLTEFLPEDSGPSVTGGSTTGTGTGVGPGTTTHPGGGTVIDEDEDEDDGDDPRDTPPPVTTVVCKAKLTGPECVCIDGIAKYVVTSNCEGECEDWRIVDENGDPSTVAKITMIDACTATVLVLSHGVFFINVTYKYKRGGKAELEKEVEAYGVFHVLGDTKEALVSCAPVVQPHPFVTLDKPAKTAEGHCLAKGSDFKVHEKRLQEGMDLLHHSDPGQRLTLERLGKEYLEIELKCEGPVKDFFKELNGARWQVISRLGRMKQSGTFKKPDDFDDGSIHSKIPGEIKWKGMTSRVVLLKGLGKHDVRIFASNAINREGTDWVTVMVGFTENAQKEISEKQKHLSELLEKGPGNNTTATHAQRLTNAVRALEQAYFRALSNPCLTVTENFQENQNFVLASADKTRTQGRHALEQGPDTMPGKVKTEHDPAKNLVMKEEKKQIFLNQKPVKNYWVTESDYNGQLYKWDEDGVLKGEKDTLLTSEFSCCQRSIPLFGVEADVPDCVTLRSIKESVILRADGKPETLDNSPGLYRWSVIAKPHKDAEVDFSPSGWTPSKSVQMTVDTPGRYNVKVEYQLGGRTCSLTFAVSDVKILVHKKVEFTWKPQRVGSYAGKLSEHVSLPYYRERIGEEVRAAEMLITPSESKQEEITMAIGPHTNPPLTSTTASNNTDKGEGFGTRFHGAFVIPKMLEFNEDITLRAYFKPYSPGLTGKDYQDFVGAPYMTVTPGAPYQVVADIEAKKEIHALHLMNIKYKNVQRFEGCAVPISGAYRDPEHEICPNKEVILGNQPPSSSTADDTPTPSVAINDSSDQEQENGWKELEPFVNLIMFTRDLGNATPSNGFIGLSNVDEFHNLPNGNFHFSMDIFQAECHGQGTDLALAYNSLEAIYHDSLEFYRRLNNVPDALIRKFWGRSPIGKGWTHSYNLYVHPYVFPRDKNGRVLDFYMAVVAPDGNRLHFKMNKGDANGNGTYKPVFSTDIWEGSTELGHSLLLEKEKNTVKLKNWHNTWWIFKKGVLSEISTPLTRNTATKKIRIETADGQTKIKDSAGRETVVGTIPESQTAYTGQLTIKRPDNVELKFDIHGRRLIAVGYVTQKWRFEYHKKIGQGDNCALLKEMQDPLETRATYEYYLDKAFESVPEEVARNFWGRLGKTTKGTQQKRTHLWFYEGYNYREPQKVVYRNPRKIEFVYTFERERLAVTGMKYILKTGDRKTGMLEQSPLYNPAEQKVDSLKQNPVMTIRYFRDTKLVHRSEDLYGEKTSHTYTAVSGQTDWYRMTKLIRPNGVKDTFEYDDDTGLPSKIFMPVKSNQTPGAFTRFYYDENQQLERRDAPPVTQGGRRHSRVRETWSYDSRGRLTGHTDIMRNEWNFAYREADRDPHTVDLHTSRTLVRSGKENLTWQVAYDMFGRQSKEFEPLFGEQQEMEYHPLGPIAKLHQQQIPYSANIGGTGLLVAGTIEFDYDALLNKTGVKTYPAFESWKFNEHGEVIEHRDKMGTTSALAYDKAGLPLSKTTPDNATTQMLYDELDRVIRKQYPAPDNRPVDKRSENFTVIVRYKDKEKEIVSQRFTVKSNGRDLDRLLLENTDIFNKGQVVEQKTRTGAQAPTQSIRYHYDQWDEIHTTEWLSHGRVQKKFVQRRDEWGRNIHEAYTDRNGRNTRPLDVVYREDGMIVNKQQGDTGSGRAESRHEYDELGRITRIRDANGTIIQEFEYVEFGNNPDADREAVIIERTQDPSVRGSTENLVFARKSLFNRRGLLSSVRLQEDDDTKLRKDYGYDKWGQLIREEDFSDRSELRYTLDNEGRAIQVDKYAYRQTAPFEDLDATRRQGVTWSGVTLQSNSYNWQGETAERTENGITRTNIYDQHGRLKKVMSKTSADQQAITEQELVYDGLGRVKERFTHHGNRQTFTFDDRKRTVEAFLQNDQTSVRTLTHTNWQGYITRYEYTRVVLDNDVEEDQRLPNVRIEYDYNTLGDLKEKRYVDTRNRNRNLAKIEYDYNGTGLISRQILTLNNSRVGTANSFTKNITYDKNLRVQSLSTQTSGGPRRNLTRTYRFLYNKAGYLKHLMRPSYFRNRGTYEQTGIHTFFEHDSRGRLTYIREGFNTQNPYTTLGLRYDRYRGGNFLLGSLNPATKNLGTEDGLKGVDWANNFTSNQEFTFQEYMYDGDGKPYCSVTSYNGPNSRSKEDWRLIYDFRAWGVNDVNVYRRYGSHRHGQTSTDDYVYLQQTSFNRRGAVINTYGRRNIGRPWFTIFGRPNAVPGRGRKQNFREVRFYSDNQARPDSSLLISEDPNNTTSSASPQNFQVGKEFFHDGAGRLLGIRHKLVRRNDNDQNHFNPSYKDNERHAFDSLFNDTMIFYEPDGSEFMRLSRIANLQGLEKKLFVNEGDTSIAEMEIFDDDFRFYEHVPGSGVRLAAIVGRFTSDRSPAKRNNHFIEAEVNYHWDHNGAALFLTNHSGFPVADFGLSLIDHQTDIFGDNRNPHLQPNVFANIGNVEAWSLYNTLPTGIDMALAKTAQGQSQSDHVLALASDPSQPMASLNNYGIMLFPFKFRQQNFTLGEQYLQSLLDEIRGIGDLVSFGLSRKARNALMNNDQELAGVKYPYSYMGGTALGVIISIYLAFAAAPLRAAQAGWAARFAMLYTITADVVSFVQSIQAIRSGKAGIFDYLGLAAPLSLFSALGGQHAKNTQTLHRMSQAANASVTEIGRTGKRVLVELQRTERATDDVVDTFKTFAHHAEILPEARAKDLVNIEKFMEPGEVAVKLADDTKSKLRKMFPRLRLKSEYTTIGDIDATYRAIWRRLFKKKELKNKAAGHRLDLNVNRRQAHYEARIFADVMNFITSDNKVLRDYGLAIVKNMFERQNRYGNSAMGASWTKAMGNMFEEGTKIQVHRILPP